MARKLIFAILICLALGPAAMAKKEKTVALTDSLMADQKYHYTMNISKVWKVKGMNEPSIERAYIEKKNYSVNQQAKAYGGDYTVPTVIIYAQDFNGTADDFEALIKKSLEEHRSDNEIISRLGLLKDSEFVTSGEIQVNSLKGRQLVVKRSYHRVLSGDAYNNSGDPTKGDKYISDHEVHDISLLKNGSTIFVIQSYSEREFYKENKIDFDKLIQSLKM